MSETTPFAPTEILQPSAIEAIQRAEVDIQIATAKRYPRVLSKVKQDMLAFATLDQETAESCFYKLPRGGKIIEGPSVRLAEIAISCYGNLRSGTRIVSTTTTGAEPHVILQSMCHDLEKNTAITIESRRRITKKRNKDTVDEDDINLATGAGGSIALRNAVFKVVPLVLVKPVMQAAKLVAIGDAKTLVERRGRAFDSFAKMGVQKQRILDTLKKKALEDVDLADLELLFGLHTAIKDGQTTIDEAFPVQQTTVEQFTKTNGTAASENGSKNPPAPKRQTTPAQAKISGDHVSAIQEVLDDRGVEWPQFKDCLRQDMDITHLTPEAIAGFQSLSELPPKVLEFYSADGCTEAKRSVDLMLQNGAKA